MLFSKNRRLSLLVGDFIVLWVGLFITLLIRYGSEQTRFREAWALHQLPFGIIFMLWLIIFYITGLYDPRVTNTIQATLKFLLYAVATGGVIAITVFYFSREFIIAPRVNLLLDLALTTGLLVIWRSAFTRWVRQSSKIQVLLFGSSSDIEELARVIETYPELGYRIMKHMDRGEDLKSFLEADAPDVVVAPKDIQTDALFVQALYETLHSGIRFIDAAMFYETLLGKIPVQLISKAWFLENIAETEKKFFEAIKRGIDLVCAFVLGIVALALFPIVAFLIKIDSRGPVFLKQKRVGKMGKTYKHYKYRTMIALGPDGHAEPNGVEWAKENDARVTRVGKWLRSTRIDELPQLWNIVKGELSFIGPRPERTEFVEELRKEIPFYDMRHLIRPGLSGWAQINPPYYYGNKREAMTKLQYDLYYIKNRDLGLDLDIMLKTMAVILSRHGR